MSLNPPFHPSIPSFLGPGSFIYIYIYPCLPYPSIHAGKPPNATLVMITAPICKTLKNVPLPTAFLL